MTDGRSAHWLITLSNSSSIANLSNSPVSANSPNSSSRPAAPPPMRLDCFAFALAAGTPSTASQKASHSSTLGGAGVSTCPTGQNHRAHQASMTSFSRPRGDPGSFSALSICSRVTAHGGPEVFRLNPRRRRCGGSLARGRSAAAATPAATAPRGAMAELDQLGRSASWWACGRDGLAPPLASASMASGRAPWLPWRRGRAPSIGGQQEVVDPPPELAVVGPTERPPRHRREPPLRQGCGGRPRGAHRSASCRGAGAGRTTGPTGPGA